MVFDQISAFALKLINSLSLAAIILVIGFVAGKVLGRVVRRVLRELEIKKMLESAGVKYHFDTVLGKTVEYLIYFFAVVLALDRLGWTPVFIYIVSSAVIIILIVAFILGVKDVVPNIIAGIFLYRRGGLKARDWVAADSFEGRIVEVGLVETKLKSKSGDTIYIPNSLLLQSKKVVKQK